MFEQTEPQGKELLSTQLNADRENLPRGDSSELIEREKITGTPFEAIRTQGMCFGVWGKYRITEYRDTMPEVHEELSDVTWDAVLRMLTIIVVAEVDHQLRERIEKLGDRRGAEMRSGVKVADEVS